MADTAKKEEKRETQKIEYLEHEKGFLDEIKSIFHYFLRSIIWWRKEKYRTQDLSWKNIF